MGLPGLIKFNENHDAVSSLFVRRTEGKANMIRVLKKEKLKTERKKKKKKMMMKKDNKFLWKCMTAAKC